MSSRDSILQRVRQSTQKRVEHPGAFPSPALRGGWRGFEDRLVTVGGESIGPVARTQLARVLRPVVEHRASGGRVIAAASLCLELGEGPWTPVADDIPPHDLEDVAVAVVRGSIAVMENGAIGIHGKDAAVQALPFLCETLVVLLSVESVVPDMHEALAALPEDALHHRHFTWVSGPSKTADIEQTLVIGAHGPRALIAVGIDAE